MSTIKHSKLGTKTQFVRYAQSSQVQDFDDSSVSYASSISFIAEWIVIINGELIINIISLLN